MGNMKALKNAWKEWTIIISNNRHSNEKNAEFQQVHVLFYFLSTIYDCNFRLSDFYMPQEQKRY